LPWDRFGGADYSARPSKMSLNPRTDTPATARARPAGASAVRLLRRRGEILEFAGVQHARPRTPVGRIGRSGAGQVERHDDIRGNRILAGVLGGRAIAQNLDDGAGDLAEPPVRHDSFELDVARRAVLLDDIRNRGA